MAENGTGRGQEPGDRRRNDRRSGDRRRSDRRAPVPVWRQPWALVAYGALAAFLVVMAVRGLADGDEPRTPAITAEGATAPTTRTPRAPREGEVAEDAMTASDFERLLIEGDAAKGRLVRVQLACGPVSSVSMRSLDSPEEAVAELADAGSRVPAAECRWGGRAEERRPDFLLLVPPELAEAFSATPVVADGFVRRRAMVADVEWIGRAESLALRTSGVLVRVVSGG
jgi:hypothetical protein